MGGYTLGQVLHGSATTPEAIRRAIQRSRESLRALAKRHGIKPKTVAKWKKAQLRRRSADRPETAELNRAVDRGGGDCRRVPSAHAVAARRLPLCAAADNPAPDPIVTASLSETAWHLAPAAGGERERRETKIQNLPDRLFPYRHR